MNRQHAFAAVAALLLSATPALASDEGYYVTGTAGVSLNPDLRLKSGALGTQKEKFDTGYAAGGAVGYDDGDGKRIELSSLYTRSDLKSVDGIGAGGSLAATSLMVNGQYDLTQNTTTTPYVGAGVGVQYIDGKIGAFSGNDWKPAYQLEAGVRQDMTDKISVFGEYRFSQSAAASFDNTVVPAHQHFSDHGLLAGLSYRIGE